MRAALAAAWTEPVGPTRTAAPRRSRRVPALALAGVLAALGVAGAMTWRGGVERRPATEAPVPEERPTLLVVPFENVAGDQALAWLGAGLAQALGDRLTEPAEERDQRLRLERLARHVAEVVVELPRATRFTAPLHVARARRRSPEQRHATRRPSSP